MQEILQGLQRTPQQIQQLAIHFQYHQGIAKLNKMGNICCLNEYCERMHYVEFEEGQQIIKIGEIGEIFYLLFDGQIDSKCTYFGVESFLNLPYLYSIKSVTKTQFATISKHDFQIIQKKAKLKDPNEQIDFFRQSQLFGQLSKVMIEKLLKNCSIEIFDKNQMIYFEGDKSDNIYLVRDGVFQISKKMNVGSRWKIIPIVEIGSNQLFGDLECLLNKPRYFNVKCLSPGTCFKITNDEFYQKVISDQPGSDVQRYMNEYIKAQLLNRAERIQTVTETLALNSEYLIGLPEINNSRHKDLSQVEMKILDKTHNRYAHIYNQSCQKRVKVRYATIYKNDAAIPRVTSKQESINKTITVSIEKPAKYYVYDEIKMPSIIQHRYRELLPKNKKEHWIITQNNKSSIL